jgi:hypothetical protein
VGTEGPVSGWGEGGGGICHRPTSLGGFYNKASSAGARRTTTTAVFSRSKSVFPCRCTSRLHKERDCIRTPVCVQTQYAKSLSRRGTQTRAAQLRLIVFGVVRAPNVNFVFKKLNECLGGETS